MSSLIIQNWYCTTENNKLKYAKECITSLQDTVNLTKHRLVIINQNSCKEAREVLTGLAKKDGITVINLSENIGTAKGINFGLRMREPNEMCIKTDEDLTWGQSGWIEKMEAEIKKRPIIGILGLKRDDVYGEMTAEGNLLWSHDIFGTCTMFNHAMLDKVGYSYQFSKYGFEDNLMSVRSEAAGFRNAFLSTVKITNLDLVPTAYTEWKKREAGIYLHEFSILHGMIKSGELPFYYDGE